jgi:DNA-binding Lrp family transcriptional regulator
VIALEPLTKRSVQLLRKLFEKARFTTNYTLSAKQDELSTQLGISRQAYNVHLRRLKNRGYIRTGRGFIEITEKGLSALGISSTPAFILIRVSPAKRVEVYEKLTKIAVLQAFRVAGEVDSLIVIESENLDDILKQLCDMDGVQETRSYVTIETLK